MINILKRKTQLASATFAAGIMFAQSEANASAADLNTVTQQIGNQTENIPQLINGVFFVAGMGLVGLGLFGVKKHVDSNGQEKLPPALAKAGIGGALMALPVLADGAVGTLLGTNVQTQGVIGQTTTIF